MCVCVCAEQVSKLVSHFFKSVKTYKHTHIHTYTHTHTHTHMRQHAGYDDDNKPSVFTEVLRPCFTYTGPLPSSQPSPSTTTSPPHPHPPAPSVPPGGVAGSRGSKPLQVQINVSLSPTDIRASILLNKLRLISVFDLIMQLKGFVFDKLPASPDEWEVCVCVCVCVCVSCSPLDKNQKQQKKFHKHKSYNAIGFR